MGTLLRRPTQTWFPFMPPPPPLPDTMNVYGRYQTRPGRLYLTIRRGSKWAKVPVGHRFTLTEQPDGPTGTRTVAGEGEVRQLVTLKFSDLPAKLLQKLHTGEKTYSDLLAAMRRAYGKEFREDEEVLVLTYKWLSSSQDAQAA